MAKDALGQDSLVGQTLGHYRLVERIGEGHMGIVYRAHDLHLNNREVAIKILPQGALADDAARQRFRKEAQALSKLSHPNIAMIIDFDSCHGMDYLVEELIEGVSLEDMLLEGALGEKEVIHLGCQLCDGLTAAHEQGIIHRDVKPGNIRVTADARLKIVDFGLAKTFRLPLFAGPETISLSETQSIAGTWPYMSPEQLCNDKLDSRSDIWAIGCVLYEMITGRRPFLGQGLALIDEILHQPPAQPSKLNHAITPGLEATVLKCLEKDPASRFASAHEIEVELRRTKSFSFFKKLARWVRQHLKPLLLVLAVTGLLVGMRHYVNILYIGWRAGQQVGQPLPPHDLYLQGQRLFERWDKANNLDAAIASFKEAVSADPKFALAYSALGEAYWAKYRLERDSRFIDEAEQYSRRAAQLNNQLPAVYVTLARVHNGKGEYNLALQEIQRARQIQPHDPDAMRGEAAVCASMGQDEKAESLYKKASALRPASWAGFYDLGVFYYHQRRYSDAAAGFRRALEITPDNGMVYATLGGMMQLLHKDAEAEQYLKRSIELQPSYVAYTNLGALYYRQRRWDESASATRHALEFNDKDWRAWSNLGLASEWLNRKSVAENAYRQETIRLEDVAKIRGDDPEIQVELGLLYSKQKLATKALPLVEAALAAAPEDSSVLTAAVEVYENLGDRDHALELLEKTLAKGLTMPQLQNDPGKQALLLDPRLQAIARKYQTQSNPARDKHQ